MLKLAQNSTATKYRLLILKRSISFALSTSIPNIRNQKNLKAGGCFAKAKMKINTALVVYGKTKTRTDGRVRPTYKIDFSNPACINLKSYKIVSCKSGEHNFNCKKKLFDPVF